MDRCTDGTRGAAVSTMFSSCFSSSGHTGASMVSEFSILAFLRDGVATGVSSSGHEGSTTLRMYFDPTRQADSLECEGGRHPFSTSIRSVQGKDEVVFNTPGAVEEEPMRFCGKCASSRRLLFEASRSFFKMNFWCQVRAACAS